MIAHDASGRVDETALEGLLAAYARVHGRLAHERLRAGDRAVIAAFTEPLATDVERVGSSWACAVGAVHGPRPLHAAPAEDLDGQFALVASDDGSRTVTVASDPFAMLGVFVADRDGVTYVSTSPLALATHLRARPDTTAIAAFLLTGGYFGRMTAWEGIERLESATRVVFGPAGPRREQYWQPMVDPEIRGLGFSAAVDRCIDVAVTTLRQREWDGGTWLDLTGGFDSRLLALLLDRAGVPFECNTVGEPGDPDVEIAQGIARSRGWPWRRLALPPDWPQHAPAFATQALAAGGGQLDAVQLAEVMWHHRAKAAVRPSLLGGAGGEHWRHYAWAQEFWRAGRPEVNFDNWIDMRMLGPFDHALLARDVLPEVRADFGRRMRDRAARYAGQPNTTQLDAMYAFKSTGHFGAYGHAAAPYLTFSYPFYFRAPFTATFSVRWQHRHLVRMQRAAIARLDPHVAAMMTERGGPAEPVRATNVHRFAPYAARQLRGLVPKVSQRVLGRRLLSEHSRLPPIAAAGRQAILRDAAIDPSALRSRGLVRPEAVAELLTDATDPGFDRWSILGRILTIELALRAADAAIETAG